MKTTLQILEEARALIAEPEHWTRYTLARTIEGVPVESCDPDASMWCAVGAAQKVAGQESNEDLMALLALQQQLPPNWPELGNYNDGMGHAAVRDLFDRAIAAEREVAP